MCSGEAIFRCEKSANNITLRPRWNQLVNHSVLLIGDRRAELLKTNWSNIMKRIIAVITAAFLVVPVAAVAQGTNKGKAPGPGQSENAPGQKQTAPGTAKDSAPGQLQQNPGDAKKFAPGQQETPPATKKTK